MKPDLGHMITFSFDTFILKKLLEKTPISMANYSVIHAECPAELNIC